MGMDRTGLGMDGNRSEWMRMARNVRECPNSFFPLD